MRVLFVLSSNYSGSHLLARALGAHPACEDIGELRNLRKFRGRQTQNVSGTRTRYGGSLFDGLEALPEERWHETLAERLSPDAPRPVLVDSSKRLDWVGRLMDAMPALDAQCVHLLRDPRAVAQRWQDTFAEPRAQRRARLREARRAPRRAWAILRGPSILVHAHRWVRENTEIEAFLRARAPGAPRVSYEALVADPGATLAQIMPMVGLRYDAVQLRYGEAAAHGSRKVAWEAAAARSSWQEDRRWTERMRPADRARIEALPALRALMDRLGYGFEGDRMCAVRGP